MTWKGILKIRKQGGGQITSWLVYLVDYDLPIQIAKLLQKNVDGSMSNRKKNNGLADKLDRLDRLNEGATIGEISKKVEELFNRYDRPQLRGSPNHRALNVYNTVPADFNTMTDIQLEQATKYAIHLIEQA